MASLAEDVTHQRHIAKLRSMSSLSETAVHRNSIETNKSSDDDEEDPEEVAYRERLRTLASLAEETVDLEEDATKVQQSAERAQKALQRSRSAAPKAMNWWVAGQGKKLFVRSVSGDKADLLQEG
jgi:hypothetical protein